MSRDTAYAIVHQDKQIAKLSLSPYESTPTNLVIEASVTYSGHGLHGGSIVSGHQGQWLASASPDGYVLLRTNTSMVSGWKTFWKIQGNKIMNDILNDFM